MDIDFVRGGEGVIAVPPERLPPEFRTLYRACVRSAGDLLREKGLRKPLDRFAACPNSVISVGWLRAASHGGQLLTSFLADTIARGGQGDRLGD